jgi:ankyrin repeat protein
MASRPTTSPAAPAAAASADAPAAAPAPIAAAAGDDHGVRKRPHDDEGATLPPPPPQPPAPPPPPLAAPFRGPAADSRLGNRFLDIIALVSANGFALDARQTRFLCGLTLREGMRRADGSPDRAGFAGGPADMIRRALEAQAPWLRAARAAPRGDAWMHGRTFSRTTSLIRAAAAGDERRVRELLAAGAPLRCVDGDRWTALLHASRQGSAQVVAALLEADKAGATVDAQNNSCDTALLWMSFNNNEGAVRLLLARGARQDLQNKGGMTALHYAAERGHTGVVEQLCAARGAAAAATLRDEDGCSPHALAVRYGHVACATVLHALAQRRVEAANARTVAASSAERAACEARFVAAASAAAAAGLPAPFRGPAADSRLGERFLDIIALVSANGFALDARPTRFLCGLTLREGARRADGSLDRAGFAGGPADMIRRALEAQAPWLRAARTAPREDAQLHGASFAGTTSLIRAAAAGDERRVRELLAAGAPLRCLDGKRFTALHHASWQGSTHVVAALHEADAATIDAQNKFGDTALIQASWRGNEAAVRLLLERGARQELQNKQGMTALHHAARKGYAGVVELLCAAPGAAAAAALRDYMYSETPLILAVAGNSCSECLVSALLTADAAGVTVNAQTDGDDMALIRASASDQNGALHVVICKGHTALMWASKNGHAAAVRLLLARGAQQELQNEDGDAALHFAAGWGHAAIVEQLCAAPGAAAAVSLRDRRGNTPLVRAVSNVGGSERLVAALLAVDAAGAKLDSQNNLGSTALMRASQEGNEGAVRLLLARGARQELQSNSGDTALHRAAKEGHVGVVEQLCAAPGAAAAVALRNEDGDTPLALAVSDGGGSERLVAALLSADAAGAIVDAQNNKGDTALILASYNGYEGAVRLLLARGALQELQNENGMTALHCAAYKGHAGVVEQLRAATGAAAAIALRNKNGDTPLALAVRYGHAATASVLRAHGAL